MYGFFPQKINFISEGFEQDLNVTALKLYRFKFGTKSIHLQQKLNIY